MSQDNNTVALEPIPLTYQFDSESPPIQYFKLSLNHFDGSLWQPESTVSIKDDILLSPDEYLSLDTNLSGLDLSTKDTTVLNFQVGKGKTRLIHDCMLRYLANPDDYVIFYVAPFKRLLEQNKREIKELAARESPPLSIRIHNCTQKQKPPKKGHPITDDGLSANIYLMTPEFLMGSGGKAYQSQSQARTDFKKALLDHIKKQGKTIVLFLDEAHENVKMYTTTRFAHLYAITPASVSKIFVASATFTRESVEVVKAVSVLTKRRITVFQGDRIKAPQQADLHLHICTESYKHNSLGSLESGLSRVLQDSIVKEHRVHILTAHKEMAKAIKDNTDRLEDVIKQLNPQLLTADEDKVFDEKQHSIGTTFTTGINITEAASTLVVILPGTIPPQYGKTQDTFSGYGIFTGGYIALIQSIARLRNGGEIHIFMRSFDNYIHSKKASENRKAETLIRQAKLKPLEQIEISEVDLFSCFKVVYNKEIATYESFASDIKGSSSKGSTLYDEHKAYFGTPPKLYDFILSEYANYRMANSHIEGKLLSPLSLWLALNNQFTNCTLKTATTYPSKKTTQKQGNLNEFEETIKEAGLEECLPHPPRKRLEVLLTLLSNRSKQLPSSLAPLQELSDAVSICRNELRSSALRKTKKLYIPEVVHTVLTATSWQVLIESTKAMQDHQLTQSGKLALPKKSSAAAVVDDIAESLLSTGFAGKPKRMTGKEFDRKIKYRKLNTIVTSAN